MLGGKVATLSSSDMLKSSALAQLFGWAQSALSPVQKEKDGYAYSDMYNHMYVCMYIYICIYIYIYIHVCITYMYVCIFITIYLWNVYVIHTCSIYIYNRHFGTHTSHSYIHKYARIHTTKHALPRILPSVLKIQDTLQGLNLCICMCLHTRACVRVPCSRQGTIVRCGAKGKPDPKVGERSM